MAETTNDLNSLTKSLGADFPVLPVSKGKKPVSSQEYSDTLIKIAPEKIKAIEAMGTAEQKQKEIQAGGKRKVTEDYAKVAHEDTEKYDKEFEKLKQPEFAPTKENAQSLGELFSLVATMGVMLGGSGKMAAQGAMDAMTGMLKGWQSGRKDLYERQLKEYDKETKRIDSERTALTNKLSRLSQLRLIDKEAAYALQAEIEAQFPGVIAATVRNQSIDVVYKMVESLQKQATSREEKEESLKLRRDIAAMKAAGGGEGRKETRQDSEQYNARISFVPKLEKTQEKLKKINDAGLWDKVSVLIALPTAVAERSLRSNKDLQKAGLTDDAISLVRDFAQFRSEEFKTAGKALTKREDQILSPLYSSSLREYGALNNALTQSMQEMKVQNLLLERDVPSLRKSSESKQAIIQQAYPQTPEFASEEEADQAYKDKKITNKQTVIVNGERYIYHAP